MAASFSKCPTCKRPKRADVPCIYCGRAAPAAGGGGGGGGYSGLPTTCANCGERRPPKVADDAPNFRCFGCGAVNRPKGGAPAGNNGAGPAPHAPELAANEFESAANSATSAHGAVALAPADLAGAAAGPASSLRAPAASAARARPSAAAAKPATAGAAASVKAQQLSVLQVRALETRTWLSLGYVLWIVPLAIACASALQALTWLLPLNPQAHVLALLIAPAALLVLGTAVGLVRRYLARVAVENQCAAILPRDRGASARCRVCGGPLSARLFIERCRACQSDNIAERSIVQRANKDDAHLQWDAGHPIADEVTFRCEALERTRTAARVSTALLPALAIAALCGTAWAEGWKLPANDRSRYAVITSPDCNMVVTASGPIRDGFVRTGMTLRGSWVREQLPLAYNQTFRPLEFVNKRAKLGPQPGTITSVYRTTRDPTFRMLVDVGRGRKLESPLLRSCLEEKHPYRNAQALTEEDISKTAKKKLAADDRERRIQQGQLHEAPAEPRKGKRRGR